MSNGALTRRTAAEESARLHRARRVAELAELDAALCAADRELQACRVKCAEALVQLCRGRPQEALQRMLDAVQQIDQARVRLRRLFDNYGSRDHDDGT